MESHATKVMSTVQPLRPPRHSTHENVRNTANFKPNIWGTRFINYIGDDPESFAQKEKQVEELKRKVRNELLTMASDPLKQLRLIDLLQRLGISYHFKTEIDDAIEHIFIDMHNIVASDDNIQNVALGFRILREHGYFVPCDVFNKFKRKSGGFSEHLASDAEGLLNLYEAAYLRFTGEDILDEALAFTTTHLKSLSADSNNPLAKQVKHRLQRPLRKCIPRVEARYYINVYKENHSHDKTILMLAQLDFNLLQSLHKKELQDLSLWWKNSKFVEKFPFIRDRLVQCYFWIMSIYFEPQYALGRRILTKVIKILSILDDIYDAYGTLDELKLLTEMIKRWDINCKAQLPDYMQIFYQDLIDLFEEIELEMSKKGTLFGVPYVKQAMADLAEGFYKEAIWCYENYIPTMDEYMKVALETCAYPVLIAVSFLGMGDIVTKETFDWVSSNPKMVRASSIICRLMDDIAGSEFEHERNHVASAVDCYMKEYGVSVEEAKHELKNQVEEAWKDVNQGFMRPSPIPFPLLMNIINFDRVVDVLYTDQDGYTHVGKVAKDLVTSMFIDPVPV